MTDCAHRWHAAAESVAGDCRAEQESLQQLRQPGSLPSADAASSLVQDITARSQQHGPGAISQELLQLVAERCIDAGEQWAHAQHARMRFSILAAQWMPLPSSMGCMPGLVLWCTYCG